MSGNLSGWIDLAFVPYMGKLPNAWDFEIKQTHSIFPIAKNAEKLKNPFSPADLLLKFHHFLWHLGWVNKPRNFNQFPPIRGRILLQVMVTATPPPNHRRTYPSNRFLGQHLAQRSANKVQCTFAPTM